MKLLIAIVQDEDASKLVSSLMSEGFGVTKLATTGGFLKAGNTTLLIGVDDVKMDAALAVIEKVCHSRKQMTSAQTQVITSPAGGFTASYPIEVVVGGATVFVLNVEQFKKF